MGIFFSRKSRVTKQDKAVLQLKQQRDKLKQYQKKIENNLGKDREVARTLIQKGRKERALSLLRMKRFKEDQLKKLDGMLENIEKMISDLEYTQVEMKVLEGLKAGNTALKKLHEVISVSEVEKIMDETMDSIRQQQEIDEILQGALTQEDEEAVLDELNEIITSTEGEEITNKLDNLPEVVDEELPEKEEQGDQIGEKASRKKQKIALEA